jgi:hypothetical protein
MAGFDLHKYYIDLGIPKITGDKDLYMIHDVCSVHQQYKITTVYAHMTLTQ